MLVNVGLIVSAAVVCFLGRELVSTRGALMAATVGFFVIEWLLALYCARQLRRREEEVPQSLPSLFVLIPVSGASADLAKTVHAFQAQQYPGSYRVVYVVPLEEDPAYEVLKKAGAEVWVTREKSSRAGGKLVSLAFGMDRVPEEYELVLLSDGDVYPHDLFAARMAGALAAPGTALAVGSSVPIFEKGSPWGALALAWAAGDFPRTILMPQPWGGATIGRRSDFYSVHVSDHWRRSICDDGTVARLFSTVGKVRFVFEAMIPHSAKQDGKTFFDQLHRWLLNARIYLPGLWITGAIALMGKTALFLSFVYPRPSFPWIIGFLGVDAAYFGFLAAMISIRVGGSAWAGIAAGLAAPLLWLVVLMEFVRSAVDNVIDWHSIRYRVRAHDDIEVIP